MEECWDPKENRKTREFTLEEHEWIKNERFLCQIDFNYWCTRYAKIRDWQDRIVHFKPNVAQQIILDIWSEMQEEGIAIMLDELKARQLGVSTITELAIEHRAQFWSNVNAVVASSDPDKSAKMAQMMELCLDHQPRWLAPQMTKYKSGILMEFGLQNSSVSIQHGTQFSGIARGTTPNVVHLSELCDYDNPKDLVDASLLKAMHESPWTFLVLESTAKGRGNWWHDTWLISKTGWPARRSRLRPIFLPWFMGTDIYPTVTWLKAHPIPKDWRPADITYNHAKRAEAAVADNDLYRKYLGTGWKMPKEQMWFWEVDRAEYVAKKELPLFLSEMPANDEEAFQSSNLSVFDVDTIEHYRSKVTSPYERGGGVYGIRGDGVPDAMYPSEQNVDHDRPPIRISARWLESHPVLNFELVPLRWDGYERDDGLNKIYIWEPPIDEEEYLFGVDTGDGVGADRSVLEMLRKGNWTRNDEFVCEMASPYINSMDLWPICMAIGTYYSIRRGGSLRQPKAVIENRWNGENCQLELRKAGWYNFHNWLRYDSKKISEKRSNKLGWFTQQWSRDLMMDRITKYIRDCSLDINSPWMINEMNDLERDEFEQHSKAQAAFGCFDDRFMAGGAALVSAHVLEATTKTGVRYVQRNAEDVRGVGKQHEAEMQYDENVPDYARASFLP